jgi:hypothetical protein
MTPRIFVSQARRAIVDRNLALYEDMLMSGKADKVSDPYWRRTLQLYHSLDASGQAALRETIRQTMVDTISSIFAVLDGVSAIADAPEEFVLTTRSQGQPINGNLQDLFLEMEEKDGRHS